MLDVEHDEVGKLHKPVKLLYELIVPRLKCYARCIYAGMHIILLGQREQIYEKINLHQRLAAGHGDTARLIEGLIALVL